MFFYPDKDAFKKIAEQGNVTVIPVCTEIINDEMTPISIFEGLEKKSEYAYLLESVEKGENLGRYTIIGIDPIAILSYDYKQKLFTIKKGKKIKNINTIDPLSEVRTFMSKFKSLKVAGMPPFIGGAVGFLGYDVIRTVEDLPNMQPQDVDIPDMVFMVSDTVIVFDHLKHRIYVCCNAVLKNNPEKAFDKAVKKIEKLIKNKLEKIKFKKGGHFVCVERDKILGDVNIGTSNFEKEDFKKVVEKGKEYIKAGDIFQVVLSQRFKRQIASEPFEIYRALRSINPSPYMFYLKLDKLCFAGSSPETMVKVMDGKVINKPIAGSRPRGHNEEEDAKFVKELLADEKENAEHIMLVDLGRNDIGKVACKGTVNVTELMTVEKYSCIMHIVSKVEGDLLPDKDVYDVIKATFPAGTLSGAPKIRAMEIIDELEPTKRGPYGGLLGYISFSGEMDTCITIRTLVCKDNIAYVQAGAGIVFDSDPEKEYQESVNKAKALLRAVEIADRRALK